MPIVFGVDRDAELFRALADRSTRQAISQHLDMLEAAGLVHSTRQGRYRIFELDTTPLRAITARWPAQEE